MSNANTIIFKNRLGMKRECDVNLNKGHGKVQKLAIAKDGSGYTALTEENVNILSNVIIKKHPGYELISEGTTENSILFNMLSQAQSNEIISLEPDQPSANDHLTTAQVYPSIPGHYDGAPSTSAISEECAQLQRSLRIGGKNMRLLAKMVGESSQDSKVPSALDADATFVVPVGAVDLDAAKDLVSGMIQNLHNLQQKYQDGVEVETAILAELEAQADKQRAKVVALIEGVNYLKNVTDAVTAFDLV